MQQKMHSTTMQDDMHDDVWYVDSGASNHMTSRGNWFKELDAMRSPGYVETGDDTVHPIEHMGKVPLVMQDGKVKHLENVLHVPTITKNLVSVGQMVDQGLQVRFNSHGVFVEDLKNKCKLVTKGEKKGRLFTLDVTMPNADTAMYVDSSRVINDIDIWHKRIGHANMQRLKSMQSSGVVTGLPKFKDNAIVKVCAACQFGKQARHRFMRHEIESSKPLEIIHSDVWTADTMTIGGCYYFVTFIDDYSRKVWVYFMKAKSEVFAYFQEFKAMVEKETGLQIKCLQF